MRGGSGAAGWRGSQCASGQEQLASLAPSSGASRHLLPLRRRRAPITTFCRFAGEGCSGRWVGSLAEEALLPFTGEGARRADEGARAQRSVPFIRTPPLQRARDERRATIAPQSPPRLPQETPP